MLHQPITEETYQGKPGPMLAQINVCIHYVPKYARNILPSRFSKHHRQYKHAVACYLIFRPIIA
jgi:hypothetical protein